MRDCRHIHNLWLLSVHHSNWKDFFHFDLKNWTGSNLSMNIDKNFSQDWTLIFGTALWEIWICCNNMVFKDVDPETVMELLWQIHAMSHELRFAHLIVEADCGVVQ